MPPSLFVLLVVAVDHALEECSRLISQCTGIDVNHKEEGKHKTNDDMKDIIKQESADLKYGIGYFLRVHKPNPGYYDQWHTQIHDHYIGYFLQGIELLFFGNGEWMRATFKNPDGVEMKLLP